MRVVLVFTFLFFGSFVRIQSDGDIEGSIVEADDFQENNLTKNEEFDDNLRIKCDELEEYNRCDANPLCQSTCETYNKNLTAGNPCPRSKSCIEGCVCKQGYVRLFYYGPCVNHEYCKIYQKYVSRVFN